MVKSRRRDSSIGGGDSVRFEEPRSPMTASPAVSEERNDRVSRFVNIFGALKFVVSTLMAQVTAREALVFDQILPLHGMGG